ncbi:MAG TPA: Mth938-like domain-containing protein [Levilinea sp.]|nr:Mth938-like domain-containing protein [Levilinea sp.]
MKPKIEKTKFGSITIRGVKYEHDVLIQLDGRVRKRKKKLSKEIYGTSHILSLPEAEYVYEDGAEWIVIGAGQTGMLELSDEAAQFFMEHNCQVVLLPTPEAMQYWNEAKKAGIALIHVTC